MISAASRRSLRELSRRRGRSILTILSIAVAIAAIWLFAIPGNIQTAMRERVEVDRLHTVRLAPASIQPSPEQLDELRSLPNVAALDLRTLGGANIRADGRVFWAWLIGVDDFAAQNVNIVTVDDGALPTAPLQLVTDVENLSSGKYRGRAGDSVALQAADGRWMTFAVSGEGATVRYSASVDDDSPILYLSSADVQTLTGYPGPNSIDVVAADTSPEVVAEMVASLRATLAEQFPNLEYWDVLEVWEDGDWPGAEEFDNFLVMFWVIAGVAMLSALVLIGTTMNTIIREHTREIGIMKSLGASRRQVRNGYLLTALILGGIGTAVGLALGIPLSNVVGTFMIQEFGGLDVGFTVNMLAVVLSIAMGLGGTMLATWPGLRRASRITVQQAIMDHGVVTSYGTGALDRLVQRPRFFARRTQIGLRNTSRRAGRSLAIAVQIALAVATMLAFASVAITALHEDAKDLEGGDIAIWNAGGPGLDAAAGRLIESVPGVELAQPMIYSNVELGGERFVWGLPAATTYPYDLLDGRWYTSEESDAGAHVTVIGQALAEITETEVGDVVTVETRRGPIDLEVIGIDRHLANDGQTLFIPFETVLDYEGWESGSYWVRTTQPDDATVDAVAIDIHQTLESAGYNVGSQLRYVVRQQNNEENRIVVVVIMAMGLPIVAIGMIGFVNAMTSNIIERTREIGILRSIGARKRDLRAMFRAEGLAVAFAGWLMGIPAGYVLGRLIMWVIENEFSATFEYLYPLWPVLAALLLTMVVSLLAMRLPVRRVIRMRPGTALRYE